MNEIDLLARLRDEVPGDQVSAHAERRLADAIASGPAPRRAPARRPGPRGWLARPSGPRWRLVTAGLAVAVVAAGTAAALVAGTGSAPPARLTAEELAYRAAASAARSPAVRPGQWVYRELYARPKTPFQASGITRQWATANNQTNAFYLHGRLIVGPWSTWQPLGCVSHKPFHPVPCAPGRQHYLKFRVATPFVRYSQLSSLPTSPRRLISVLAAKNPHGYLYNMALQPGSMADEQPGRAHTEHEYAGSPALRAFSVISNLLSTYVMPPRLTAELYRALGDLHGVEVYRNVMDVTGRHGIAFYMPFRPHARTGEDIIVNPRTYQLMGFGNHQDGTAVLYQAIVAGPGIRPGQR